MLVQYELFALSLIIVYCTTFIAMWLPASIIFENIIFIIIDINVFIIVAYRICHYIFILLDKFDMAAHTSDLAIDLMPEYQFAAEDGQVLSLSTLIT